MAIPDKLRQSKAAHPPASVSLKGISKGDVTAAKVVADGEYELTIDDVRPVQSKHGSISIILSGKVEGHQAPVLLRPLLVFSPSGSSNLTTSNIELLQQMAGFGVDENVDLEEVRQKLVGSTSTVSLITVVDASTGRPINEILEVLV